MSRALRYLLVGIMALGGVLFYLLAVATGKTETLSGQYPLLLTLNAVIAAAMLIVIGVLLVRLWRRYRAKAFGTVLTARLTLILALMAIIPGTLVYTVSIQFLSRSIESWFNVKVDTSLESGLTLARTALDAMLQDVTGRTRLMALELADVPDGTAGPLLNRMMEQTGLQEAALLSANGRLIASSSRSLTRMSPDLPAAQIMRDAAAGRGYAGVESNAPPGGGKAAERSVLRMRVVAPVASRSLGAEPRMLQVLQNVPEALTASAESVQQGYRDYQELSLARQGLRRIFTVTLTLALLLALFAAIAAAFYISDKLAQPLSLLKEATAAVAQGDFSPINEMQTRDELGMLTQSFAQMTRQLDEARANVEAQRAALEASKAYVESVLANLNAGVLVFDGGLRLVSANAGAERLLKFDADEAARKPLDMLPGQARFAREVAHAFEQHGLDTWQQQFDLSPPMIGGTGGVTETPHQVLLVRGSRLVATDGAVPGYLVVCDDITALTSAQRSAAWGEVARRLAHEIKNPLTPIQLSAERLQMKLENKLQGTDAEVLSRSTSMIVTQVGAMKRMVDDFREYARTPPAKLETIDLNALIRDVLGLYETSRVPLKISLADALPQVRGDREQLRQVIHNLLQNAQDAVEETRGGEVRLSTEARENGVRLTVADNGTGFPPNIIARAFEPYVTTKARGTGLGLAIVKKIVDDHQGTIALENDAGARVTITLRLA